MRYLIMLVLGRPKSFAPDEANARAAPLQGRATHLGGGDEAVAILVKDLEGLAELFLVVVVLQRARPVKALRHQSSQRSARRPCSADDAPGGPAPASSSA